MLIPNRIKPAAFVAITLLLAACSASSEPAAEIGQQEGQSDQPAEATAIPNQVTSTVAATNTPAPTATPEPTATPAATSVPSALFPDLGPAPDFTNEVWLNSDGPLTLESLKGEVVLVEFWTFG